MLTAVSVPVIAAGGIATARGVAAALAAGAEGVRVGTRFIASAESNAHPAWIRAVLEAQPEDAVVSTAYNVGLPVPGPHRVLRSSIAAAEALAEGAEVGVVRMFGAEIPVQRFSPSPPTAESTGTIEAMPFYAGSVGRRRHQRQARGGDHGRAARLMLTRRGAATAATPRRARGALPQQHSPTPPR